MNWSAVESDVFMGDEESAIPLNTVILNFNLAFSNAKAFLATMEFGTLKTMNVPHEKRF